MVAKRATPKHKRHGQHQKRTPHFMKVYWPYLPLAVTLAIGLVFSALWQPRTRPSVLAYATTMNINALYQSTNKDRTNNGVGSLNLNNQLNQAAQAKANDMATRNYWSHNTPEGNPPWVFVSNAGYKYKATGENLAYGFATSEDTISGWMNSPEHKANMLNSAFTDVGFGYANSDSYNGVDSSPSPETIVVAYYATPLTSASTAAPVISQKANNIAAPPQASTVKPAAKALDSTSSVKADQSKVPSTNIPSSKPAPALVEPPTRNVSRLSVLTNGQLPWLTSLISATFVVSILALAFRHTIAIRKWWRKGERYVLHHAVFDITAISIMGLCLILNHSAGFFIR